jgi:hypothetical protein
MTTQMGTLMTMPGALAIRPLFSGAFGSRS